MSNSSLETAVTPGVPNCWTAYSYGAMTGHTDGDAKLMPTFDTGGCTPAATAGHTYLLSAWYKSSVSTQFEVYLRNAAGGFDYWTASPYFAAASTWTHAVWTTPAVPDGATGLSSGLIIFSNGTLTTDDYGYLDTADATAPAFTADAAPATATVGTAYSYTYTATGNPAPTFAVASGKLPTGLTLNARTGVLSGKPTETGTFTFTVRASNGVGKAVVTPATKITVRA